MRRYRFKTFIYFNRSNSVHYIENMSLFEGRVKKETKRFYYQAQNPNNIYESGITFLLTGLQLAGHL